MRLKIERSNKTISILESLQEKFTGLKILKMNSNNVEYYSENYEQLEPYLIHRQAEIQADSTQPQFMKQGFPSEGKLAFYIFPIIDEGSNSAYNDYKYGLFEYIQYTVHPL